MRCEAGLRCRDSSRSYPCHMPLRSGVFSACPKSAWPLYYMPCITVAFSSHVSEYL